MAAEKVGYESEIVCIDPNLTLFLIELESKGQITLHAKKAQEVDLDILTNVGDNDIFLCGLHPYCQGG
jgi:hypothetical protein